MGGWAVHAILWQAGQIMLLFFNLILSILIKRGSHYIPNYTYNESKEMNAISYFQRWNCLILWNTYTVDILKPTKNRTWIRCIILHTPLFSCADIFSVLSIAGNFERFNICGCCHYKIIKCINKCINFNTTRGRISAGT